MRRGTLLLSCVLLLGAAGARRLVSIQSGPLVRTEGSHITIWCNVTGYRGNTQEFEWSIYLWSAPEREIRVVSTVQQNYAYALFAPRVTSGEIYVERVAGDAVLLHIVQLQARDQGVYECYTPNTDGEYLGSYSARTNLTVIGDTLSVTSPALTLSRLEGDALQVNCEVTRQTLQHSHVSVGWYLRADPSGTPLDVLTLDRDFVLRPGAAYKQRFTSGDVRLDKLGSSTYRLTVHHLQPGDHGLLYCEAAEWIEDPDGAWFPMTRKQSDKSALRVQAAEKDFSLQLSTERRGYTAGEPLELRCSIDAQKAGERLFSVSWVFSSSPVAVVGPNAVPVLSGDYVQREAAGHMTVRKESVSVHLLKLQSLRPEDSGKYTCRVTERERTATGELSERTKRSRNVQISVQPLRSNMTVTVQTNSSEVDEGNPACFRCFVSSLIRSSSLSVAWRLEGEDSLEVAAVDQEGVVSLGPAYQARGAYGGVRVERAGSDTFLLCVFGSLPADGGRYTCAASEWLPAANRTWERIGERSGSAAVTIRSVESSFSVSASTRTPSLSYGHTFHLQCVLRPRYNPLAPVSAVWRFQPTGHASFQDVVSSGRDGTLQWSEQQPGLTAKAALERSLHGTSFRLSVSRAGPEEAGTYQCSAQLWRRSYDGTWTQVAERTSNPLGINVMKPGSKLHVQQTNQSLQLVEDSRVRINCSILQQSSPESQYDVLWFARKAGAEGGAELLLKMKHDAALELGTYAAEERLQSRVQAERVSAQTFALTLRRAEVADSASYFCLVEEWLPEPSGDRYLLAQESSGYTQVHITQPEVGLRVEEAESNLTLQEGGSLRLGCAIPSQSCPDSRFSVSWYVSRGLQAGVAEAECLFSVGHDGVFGKGDCSPAEVRGPESRLRFERTASDAYGLTLQWVEPRDGGNYWCHVEEWLQNPRGSWYRLAGNRSGVTVVTVLPLASTLRSSVCSSHMLFYFVFFYPFPLLAVLLTALLLVRYRSRGSGKSAEGKNGAPLLWIKEPHINYSPTCLDPPTLGMHPGSVE